MRVAEVENPPARHPWHGDSGAARTDGQQGPACAGCWQRGGRRPCDVLSTSAPASWVSLAACPEQQRQQEPGRCGREGTPSARAGSDALPSVRPCSPVTAPPAPRSLGQLGHPGLSDRDAHKGKGCQGCAGTCPTCPGAAAPPSHQQPCSPMGRRCSAPGCTRRGAGECRQLPPPQTLVSKLLRSQPQLRAGT